MNNDRIRNLYEDAKKAESFIAAAAKGGIGNSEDFWDATAFDSTSSDEETKEMPMPISEKPSFKQPQ